MRLDFNIIVVDDDLNDDDNNPDIKALIQQLKYKVQSKGFIPNIDECLNIDAARSKSSNRTDLYISDNNLGNNPSQKQSQPVSENGGIEYYLHLKQNHLSDFVLYTRSKKDSIIEKLTADLNNTKDPNLFTRFTFVSREDGGIDWHQPILAVIDHILTKREELNNIRGLYAQKTSEIDLFLKEKYKRRDSESFHDTIEGIPRKDYDKKIISDLHKIRGIRNGLMHNSETFCTKKNQYVIKFIFGGENYEIYENDLQKYRDELYQTHKTIIVATI
ncbi:hypothetical protein SAMN05192560_2312 [Methylobacillus rhizosphaerae]|uniref:Uncharacterized protein n=1 Tax=Methylobacillus rhizosphaerae TaxID=551994 RepID=A0A239B5U2_9PROT|nr:hypothetical protein [Methylobacillus rhizosphaerae]SNS03270.1 hypothetical protein SAMN05192560_2312 [Methylobacillus rhizosphaerae]